MKKETTTEEGENPRDPIFSVVTLTLGIIAIGSIIGMIYLSAKSIPIPNALVGVASTAIGALASIIAKF